MSQCVICDSKDVTEPKRVCFMCSTKTRDALMYLPYAYNSLRRLLPPGSAGERVGSSGTVVECAPPLRIAILSLLGNDQPRIKRHPSLDDQSGSPSILAFLGGWQRDFWRYGSCRRHACYTPAAPIHEPIPTVDWLVRHEAWASINPDFPYVPLHDEAKKLSTICLRTLTEQVDPSILIGHCIVPTGKKGEPCNAPLKVGPHDEAIKCPRCKTSWARAVWPMLGRRLFAKTR